MAIMERAITAGADRLGGRLQALIATQLDRMPRAADALHGTWLRHALHPAVATVPLGAWTVSTTLDAATLIGDPAWETRRAADLACGIGVAGSGLAALSGLTDWARAGGGRQRARGLAHASLNAGVATAMIASLVSGGSRRHRGAAALRLLAFGVGGYSAWLGGELVSSDGLGVDHAERSSADTWSDAMADDELGRDKHRTVRAGGVWVLLRRDQDGSVTAIGARCSHLGGPLGEGPIENGVVTCPWHGSQFRLADGSVCRGPATHPQQVFDVRTEGGRLLVRPRD
jgi:nitrite reductase/ring-hydroxylating ferredoxin subunit/uncharacterized membrane protein